MEQLDVFLQAQLKLRHLQMLVALDNFRHIGRAASSLNLSQPAVSLALGELEKGLGMVLFDRHARGVTPNAYGECIVRHARGVQTRLSQVRGELHALQTGAAGKIRVGALPAVATALLPQALVAYKQEHPQSDVQVLEGAMDELLPLLRRGALDLLVGRLMSAAADDVSEQALYDGLNVVVVRHGHPLTHKKNLGWPDLQTHPWVLPPPGSLSREPLELAFQQTGTPMPTNAIETLSVSVITAYLNQTSAIGLVSKLVARHHVRQGSLAILPLELPDPRRPIGVTWLKQRGLPPAALKLIVLLQGAVDSP
jgi:DNA-binding transcriptional LysR family regulator